jgi:hypothetical protein
METAEKNSILLKRWMVSLASPQQDFKLETNCRSFFLSNKTFKIMHSAAKVMQLQQEKK